MTMLLSEFIKSRLKNCKNDYLTPEEALEEIMQYITDKDIEIKDEKNNLKKIKYPESEERILGPWDEKNK